MAERKITIQVAAVGAQEAAAEIDRVEKATANLSEETKQSALDENVGNIARAQKAQVMAELASRTFEVGTALRATGVDIREFDAELGTAMENAGAAIEKTSVAVSALAQGFAVGGGLGAAVAASTVGLNLFKEATIETARSLAEWDQASQRAAEMQRQLAEAQRYGIENVLVAADATERLNEVTETTTDSIKRQTEALTSRNRVLNAEDRADSAKRDRADASRIAAGEDPEKVREERARYDADVQISQLNREEEAKRSLVQPSFDAYREANFQASRLKDDPNATEAQIKNADEKVEELKRQFESLQRDYHEIRDINRARRVEIGERTTSRVESAQRDRSARLGRERSSAEAEIGSDAAALVPAGVKTELRDAINRVSRGLRNGDQGGEVKELTRLIAQLANVVDGKDSNTRQDIANLRQKIGQLEGQIKNARNGK